MQCKTDDEAGSHKTSSITRNSRGISVVIPTFKRVEMCRSLLASLRDSRQRLNDPVEIIVVDDSPSAEAEQIKALCTKYGAKYHFRKLGVSAKRNFGARIASHPIILFIDSDCEATPELLVEHLALYNKNEQIVAVLGRTEFKGSESFTWKTLQFTPFLEPFRFADSEIQRVWGPSNNLSCRKEIFERVGGFDETFPNKPGGEDVDFGIRLYKEGFTLTTSPRAIVLHTTETWKALSQAFNRLFNWGRGEFYLYYNYSEDLYYDCPKAMALFLLMIPIALASAFLTKDLQWLILSPLFLAVNFSSRIILHLGFNPDRLARATHVLVSEILLLVYESGLAFECLKRRWFLPLYHRLIIVPEEASMSWNAQVFNTWATFAQLIISIFLVAYCVCHIK